MGEKSEWTTASPSGPIHPPQECTWGGPPTPEVVTPEVVATEEEGVVEGAVGIEVVHHHPDITTIVDLHLDIMTTVVHLQDHMMTVGHLQGLILLTDMGPLHLDIMMIVGHPQGTMKTVGMVGGIMKTGGMGVIGEVEPTGMEETDIWMTGMGDQVMELGGPDHQVRTTGIKDPEETIEAEADLMRGQDTK